MDWHKHPDDSDLVDAARKSAKRARNVVKARPLTERRSDRSSRRRWRRIAVRVLFVALGVGVVVLFQLAHGL